MKTERTYWDSGQLRSEYNFKDGQFHGLSKRWYESGELKLVTFHSFLLIWDKE